MQGYIKLFRELLDKPILLKSTPEQKAVLITVMLMANFRPKDWEWKGKKFKVNPGQFVTSLESIRKKTGLGISTQNVRSSLKRFEKLQFLTNKSTKSGRLISITNWDRYQPDKIQPNKDDNNGTTKGQHLLKNNKKERIKKKSIKKKIPKPPDSMDDVIEFFKENGYSKEIAIHAFKYYRDADWYDSSGKPVLSWKSKMRAVWFKPENKEKQYQSIDSIKPTTYAQAQDAERRQRAKWLREQDDNEETSDQGNIKTIPMLSGD